MFLRVLREQLKKEGCKFRKIAWIGGLYLLDKTPFMQQNPTPDGIKNLIFDLGNVIIDLDIERTWQSLQHYLGDDYSVRLRKIYPDGDIFIDYEVGKISEETFLRTLQNIAATPLSIRQISEAWNAMLLGITPERFEMLERLRSKYRVFLLSNTNETHLTFVDGYLRMIYGFDIATFDRRFFEKPYYSHLIKLRKPNAEIYEFMLKDADLNPSETLFIDDISENTEGASRVGLHVYKHSVGVEIAHVLKDF